MAPTTIQEKLLRYEKIDFLGEGQFATVYKVIPSPYWGNGVTVLLTLISVF